MSANDATNPIASKVICIDSGRLLVRIYQLFQWYLHDAWNKGVFYSEETSSRYSQTFVAAAGSVTLCLELYDGKTVDIIGRIVDPDAVEKAGICRMSGEVVNKVDGDRILRRWAELLDHHLAEVTAVTK
jgi:hypothetical protein